MPESNLPVAQAMSAEKMALMVEGARDVETFSVKQLIVPYLGIVQGTSGYVKPGTAGFIEGMAVGDIVDNLTLTPFKEVVAIMCKYEDHWTEWEVIINREGKRQRGKLIKQWFTDDSKYKASEKRGVDDGDGFPRITVEGNDIVQTPTYYSMIIGAKLKGQTDLVMSGARPVVFPMGSTQAKKSRRLNGLIDILTFNGPDGPFTAPPYAQAFKFWTAPEPTGDNTIMGWKFEPYGLTLDLPGGVALWTRAQNIRKAVEEGQMRMAPPTPRDVTEEASATTAEPTPARRGRGNEPPPRSDSEEIPF